MRRDPAVWDVGAWIGGTGLLFSLRRIFQKGRPAVLNYLRITFHVACTFPLPFPPRPGQERMAYFLPAVRSSSALAASWSQKRVQHMLFVAVSGGRRTLSSETARSAPAAPAAGDTAAADSIPDPRSQRVLHAAVAGLPNAGKSTLLNYMVGDKVRERACVEAAGGVDDAWMPRLPESSRRTHDKTVCRATPELPTPTLHAADRFRFVRKPRLSGAVTKGSHSTPPLTRERCNNSEHRRKRHREYI